MENLCELLDHSLLGVSVGTLILGNPDLRRGCGKPHLQSQLFLCQTSVLAENPQAFSKSTSFHHHKNTFLSVR